MANPTDVTIAILSKTAAALGFVLSGRCRECGSQISGQRSLHSGLGRVCRQRANAQAKESGSGVAKHPGAAASPATNQDGGTHHGI